MQHLCCKKVAIRVCLFLLPGMDQPDVERVILDKPFASNTTRDLSTPDLSIMNMTKAKKQRRNKSFEDTHSELIETAVCLIADKGAEALSIAALARAMGINRTTVYYHFDSREKLISEVKGWSSDQLAAAFRPDKSRLERMDHIYRFVLENPDLLKMLMDDFLSGGDIRKLYPPWDELVEGMREHFSGTRFEDAIDPEVFCVNLLTSAFVGPGVFKSSVCPDADTETVVERFKAETMRMLRSFDLV